MLCLDNAQDDLKTKSMNTRTDRLLSVLHVLAWVVFIGLLIKAGALLFSYGLSLNQPEAARNLYQGLDLFDLMQYSKRHYTFAVLLVVAFWFIEAWTAYLVVNILSLINRTRPFTAGVAKALERISYVLLGAWCIALLSNAHSSWLLKEVGIAYQSLPLEFILLVAVIFVIAQIFKRGVELQSENELTI